MARPRKNPADNWMPPRVRKGRSTYEFRAIDGGTIRLCSFGSSQADVWIAYEKLMVSQKSDTTFTGLIKEFLVSGDFCDLASETQKDYRKYSSKIIAVFGKMSSNSIKPEHIRTYMDKRGIKSRIQANREKSFMSRVFRWGYERGKVKLNPCTGVKQFKEVSRERYITDEEYSAVYVFASDVVRIAMEIAYLCLARQADVLSLRRDQIKEAGLYIRQGKTGVKQIKAWTGRLQNAIALAGTLPLKPGISNVYLIHQRSGIRYTRDGFNSQWRKARKAAKESHPELDFNFTFHDLKAKGISDLTGTLYDKQVISGHKNASQTARYDRKVTVVPVVGGQEEEQ